MSLIELDDVGLRFHVRRQRRMSLKEYLLHGWYRPSKQLSFEVQALEHIDLRVEQGDRMGIIGRNGAGKSTMLKVLAGIYPPTHGQRRVQGRISSLFDIALGFEMEATGWENIRYRGYLQGETPRSIQDKIEPIAEFSELGRFLDMPVRYYSAGMMVRLAFSIATSIDPEILIVDEVLSAGDMSFQVKARQRMQNLITRARAVIVVSHDLNSLRDVCNRALWIDGGHVRMAGPMDEVIAAYQESAKPDAKRKAA